MRYRTRTEIVVQLLKAARGGAGKTRVFYEAYLSYAQSKTYFAALTSTGLLEYLEKDKTYMTTAKGLQLLETYDKLNQMLEVEPVKHDALAPLPVTD